MGMQPLKRDVYDALILRTWSDKAFSRCLDEDPKAAIAEMGQRLDDVGALRVLLGISRPVPLRQQPARMIT